MRQILIAAIVGAVVGGFTVYKLWPQIKINDVTHDKIVTVTKTIRSKDGSINRTSTRTEDSSKVVVSSGSGVQTKNWHITAGVGTTIFLVPIYSGSVEKRILGPIFVGVYGTSNKEAGLKLGLEF